MELILNELSFAGQFDSKDEFAEYAETVLVPLLDVIIENEIPLLKKSDIYDYSVTHDATLQDLLMESGGKCYAEEAMLENDLGTDDLLAVVNGVVLLIEDLGQGRKSNLWDKLQEDIFELRLHVSSGRIFRLLFVQYGGIQFLNGFIKKTQQTPDREIAKAMEIKKLIKK